MDGLYELICVYKDLDKTSTARFKYKNVNFEAYMKYGFDTNHGWEYANKEATIGILSLNTKLAKEVGEIFEIFIPIISSFDVIHINIIERNV